jgi:squalene-hopene/tetraprenyl-beta-curcumene cyclase
MANASLTIDFARLRSALEKAASALLSERASGGHWEGQLSSSALSTATAVCALALVERHSQGMTFTTVVASGLDWLAKNQNPDGGWGDTLLSHSNLSTSVLAWAAFGAVPGADAKYQAAVEKAKSWITQHAASLEPAILAPAIARRYGKDRTFSAPILTMCALSGRLGEGPQAWRRVIPLPFELAALPHRWFAALNLPVVSYALPALIAIGQVRHHHLPSRNPIIRAIRNRTRPRALKVLESIQPVNGGFLEATPLTSFVTMSLAGGGQAQNPVCRKGVEFLKASQLPDGSWPIDTNLATWVTTLSVNALHQARRGETLRETDLLALRQWLLQQQFRAVHPYTHAAPGGWSWTDLPGGVPDADDTPGALLALTHLGPMDDATLQAGIAGVTWLLDLQNDDGGIPTFCRGWGALPFDRSSPDLTAHTLRAWTAWLDKLPPYIWPRAKAAMGRALVFLCNAQRSDGSWLPLWFGNQFSPTEENPTYGTTRVLAALTDPDARFRLFEGVSLALDKGLRWLLQAQNADGGWGGCPGAPSSIEETALALETLAQAAVYTLLPREISRENLWKAIARGLPWLLEQVESGQWKQPAPIGFYFAKLWYYEKLYPQIFTVSALAKIANHLPAANRT